MIFIVLTFIAALAIEGLGTLVSVIGLSALFGSNPIIIALVVALDLGKIVCVSLLYTHWKDLPKLMKGYALIASTALMVITSAGAAGYLSAAFQKAISGTQESSLKIDVLKQQQAKYEERKKQIDAQIAALPEKTTVNQRLRLMNGFKAEQQDLQAKISKIDEELPTLQIAQVDVEAHAGPILYIAKAFDVPVEVAVKWVILMIIFVFDPLAIFLIIAGNFLLAKRRTGEVYGNVIHHDEDEPPTIANFTSHASSQQVIPLEVDVDKFLETTHKEPVIQVVDSDELWWAAQDERARQSRARQIAEHAALEAEEQTKAEIKSSIASMVVEEGSSLPPIEEPKVLPDPPPKIEEVPKPIVEPPVEAPAPIKEPSRETITLSSLGLAPAKPVHHAISFDSVKADPHTVVDATQLDRSNSFQATPYPRPTKKLPAR